jgi:hypothetical protein
MVDSSGTSLEGWRYGIHPRAAGLRVRSLGRIELPLGEAVRLEMVDPAAPAADVHVQYLIDTDAGAWALWLSCPADELAGHEAALRAIVPIAPGEPEDHPPTFHPARAPFAGHET